ncbi:hypothetical protein, partial [Vibrio lentus]
SISAVIQNPAATYPTSPRANSLHAKFGVFGEIIVKNAILKTIQRISHISSVVLPPSKPLKDQQPCT